MKEINMLNWLGLEKTSPACGLKDDSLQLLVFQINNTVKLINLIQDEMTYAIDENTQRKTIRLVANMYKNLDKYLRSLTELTAPYMEEFNSRQLEPFENNNCDEKRTYIGTERTSSEFVRQHRHSIVKLREITQALLFKLPNKNLANIHFNLDKILLDYLRTPSDKFSPNFEENLAIKHYDIKNCDQITLDI